MKYLSPTSNKISPRIFLPCYPAFHSTHLPFASVEIQDCTEELQSEFQSLQVEPKVIGIDIIAPVEVEELNEKEDDKKRHLNVVFYWACWWHIIPASGRRL